jgi:hypothetical protein
MFPLLYLFPKYDYKGGVTSWSAHHMWLHYTMNVVLLGTSIWQRRPRPQPQRTLSAQYGPGMLIHGGRNGLRADGVQHDHFPQSFTRVESEAFVRAFSPGSTLEPRLKAVCRRGPKCSL